MLIIISFVSVNNVYNLEIEEKTKVVNSSKYFLSIKMMSSYPRKLILLIKSSNKTFDNKGSYIYYSFLVIWPDITRIFFINLKLYFKC